MIGKIIVAIIVIVLIIGIVIEMDFRAGPTSEKDDRGVSAKMLDGLKRGGREIGAFFHAIFEGAKDGNEKEEKKGT